MRRLDFRLAGADTPEPARIRVVRNRQVSPPASGFELYTGGGELPCNVLAMGLDELKPLGPRCRFRGYIWANETPDGWQGEVTGQLVELDLGGLVTDHFPHKLAGIGRGDDSIGPLSPRPTGRGQRHRRGRAGHDRPIALDRGRRPLGTRGRTWNRSLPASWCRTEQLAFSATLDAQGLRLRGRCDNVGHGRCWAAMASRLLGQSPRQPAPAVALVQTLVPQSAVQVPASRQTDWLLRHLPVPEVSAAARFRRRPPPRPVHICRETLQR